jgi:hypothetical protein
VIFVGAVIAAIVVAIQAVGTAIGVGVASARKRNRDVEMVNREYVITRDYYPMDDSTPYFYGGQPPTTAPRTTMNTDVYAPVDIPIPLEGGEK